MAYVYVLRSLKSGKRYVGHTSKDVYERVRQHQSGTNAWTRQNRPVELVYYEEIGDIREARERERFLKSGQGRKFLDKIIPR